MPAVTYDTPATAIEAFPLAGEAEWDPVGQEYRLVDSDGIAYYGASASECFQQYIEALHHLARSAQDSGFDIAELRQFRRL